MRLLDLPIRLLLVATFGFALPLLCCCGALRAEVRQNQVAVEQPVAPATDDAHACCTSDASHQDHEKTSADASHDGTHCGCESRPGTADEATSDVLAHVPASQSLNCFLLAPLPRLLSVVLADAQGARAPLVLADAATLSPAPSLRSLSILLLV